MTGASHAAERTPIEGVRAGSTRKPFESRFWTKVLRADDGCWTWTGCLTSKGYGQVRDGSDRRVPAHRAAYEFLIGPIPEGLVLDHLCRNRKCVNPGHLEAVTQRENILRGAGAAAAHARKTHCKRGHEFTPENTYVPASGTGRSCRRCALDRAARNCRR